ncbi:alpha-1,6-mannosylglycoprotein 6-beta-N-acetylglucosaminyltransferase A-like [Styela clava]
MARMVPRRWKRLFMFFAFFCIIHLIIIGTYTARSKRFEKKPIAGASAMVHEHDTPRQFTTTSMFSSKDTTVIPVITTATTELTTTESESNMTECELPGIVRNGVPWPNCLEKYGWMTQNWKSHSCYAEHGVNGDPCTILQYLSQEEKHCPPVKTKTRIPKLAESYAQGIAAVPRESFQHLYNEFSDIVDYAWMKNRIKNMEELWIQNSKELFNERSTPTARKRIHIHLGLMSLGIGKDAFKGGPLGELVQWSDLIASLFIMGHDIVVTKTKPELTFIYQDYMNAWDGSPCPPLASNKAAKPPFDIIYSDIRGYKEWLHLLGESKAQPLKCRVRIVDSFGTEAMFNHPPYREAKKLPKSQYSGINLNLMQFNVMFPHTPDNTFLGFVTEFAKTRESIMNVNASDSYERNIALIYGKLENFWKDKEKYIDIISEYVSEVHATVHEPKNLRPYIINHGIVGRAELNKLLARTKIFVGLGFPFEGPAPLEAIQKGAIFLNPYFSTPISFLNHDFYKLKPTKRAISSQNPYAEKFIGKPHVYTVNIEDETALRAALSEIMNSSHPGNYLAYEFSVRGMLERVSVQIDRQQFCVNVPYPPDLEEKLRWPPLSALRTRVSTHSKWQSCNEVCDEEGLICEPSFFPILNRKEAFGALGFICNSTMHLQTQELDYPAYDKNNGICYLQSNSYLFSCAGNYLNMQRICPCRDFRKGQVALCRDCGLK